MLVFVSYCLRDLSLVKPLMLQLGVLGHNVQYESKMPGGQTRWTQVMAGIAACDVFILGLTDHSLLSESRRLELEYAKLLGKPIVAVRLSKMKTETPTEFARAVDYLSRNPQRAVVLARALNTLPPPTPPSTLAVVPDWRALLLKIRRHIKAPQLTTADQQMIVLNLQELLERRETFRGSESLLRLLASRRGIDQKAKSRIQHITKQLRQSHTRQNLARWRNIALIGLVFLAIAMVPLFLAFRKARTDAAAKTQMAEATITMMGTQVGPTLTSTPTKPDPSATSTRTSTLTLTWTEEPTLTLTSTPESDLTILPEITATARLVG